MTIELRHTGLDPTSRFFDPPEEAGARLKAGVTTVGLEETMSGRFYEDWAIGDRIEHPIRRTVTETDNLLFSTMTHNPQPLHIDAEAAAASEWGRILVNGTFTFALMVGLTVGETTLGTLVANLGYDRVTMPAPVFLGDTIRATSEVTGLRESRSRPEAGLVTFVHEAINQRGEVVCRCERTALVRRRPA